MSNLVFRTWLLIVCRVSNYAVMIISPVFLVRILDVTAYGQYREFVLYAMIFAGFIGFAVNSNLLYFIPKHPDKERDYVNSTVLFRFVTTLVGVIILFALKPILAEKFSYDFTTKLIIYLFCFLNLDLLDSFWLGKKRSDYVLYFTTARMTLRVAVLISVAYSTRSVGAIINALIIVEGVRLFVAFVYLLQIGCLFRKLNVKMMKEQILYFAPLGIVSIMNYLNRDVGKVFISASLGASSLAIFTIGSYQLPFLSIVRESVGDVIFPEVTQRNVKDLKHGLDLWKKSNVIYCVIAFPLFVVFFCYADVFVITMFTTKYMAAIPVFRVYLFYMIRQCFEMSIPIRSLNKNNYFIVSSTLSVPINIVLIVLFSKWFGMVGPALAFVISDLIQALYLCVIILHFYEIGLKDILPWKSIIQISVASAIGLPIIGLGTLIHFNPLVKAILISLIYFTVYIAVILQLRVSEFKLLLQKICSSVSRIPIIRSLMSKNVSR